MKKLEIVVNNLNMSFKVKILSDREGLTYQVCGTIRNGMAICEAGTPKWMEYEVMGYLAAEGLRFHAEKANCEREYADLRELVKWRTGQSSGRT